MRFERLTGTPSSVSLAAKMLILTWSNADLISRKHAIILSFFRKAALTNAQSVEMLSLAEWPERKPDCRSLIRELDSKKCSNLFVISRSNNFLMQDARTIGLKDEGSELFGRGTTLKMFQESGT